MSYAQLNGAQIFFELYGVERPERGQTPIFLIHGATVTGQSDWGAIIPLLARRYPVVVPDCRGHGRSTNPHGSYSFHEMAADVAELILRLGYERAHVVGHSNGGNVALVTLLEYPEVVQTCTLQAANAYVSADLLEREPGTLDPERIETQSPAWMREMISLHGPMHGREYWRELLRLTLAETISQPNYTAEDLALARRPTLVIEGENDTVNAPAHHGRFLAEHIPEAEWWRPEGVGHSVHKELPWVWTERLLDFLTRRGDPANNALDRLALHDYGDARATVFNVRAEWAAPRAAASLVGRGASGNGDGAPPDEDTWWLTPADLPSVRVTGQVLDVAQRDAVREALELANLNVAGISDSIRVLLSEDTPRATINVPVIDVRPVPEAQVARLTQALLGETVRVLETVDAWAHVRLDVDGYLGWLEAAALLPDHTEPAALPPAVESVMVVVPGAAAFARPARSAPQVGQLPFGVVLPVAVRRQHWVAVRLPAGDRWWLPAADVLSCAQRPCPDPTGIERALVLLRRLVGVPNLWGGRSAFGYDCAGLVQAFFHLLDIAVPRDADRQFAAGCAVEGPPQAGDLLFFATQAARTDSRQRDRGAGIAHVAISLGGWDIIQAGGGSLLVNTLRLDSPANPAAAWLREHLAGVRRLVDLPDVVA